MSRRIVGSLAVVAGALAMVVVLAAQGGGTGGGQGGSAGGRGGGFGGARGGGGGGGFQLPTRLVMLTSAFKLDKAQVQAVKTMLDEEAKDASVAATRMELTTAHAAIGAAIEKGASPDAIDAAVKAYAAVSQKMADLELASLAKVIKSLNDTQRGNANATTAAVALMRGAFVDKKWDVTPGTSNY